MKGTVSARCQVARRALRMLMLPRARRDSERLGWLMGSVLFVVATAVAIWRVRGSLDRMWAEDWAIYVRGAKVDGCHPLQGYAGYAQVPARLWGCVTAEFPIQQWPVVMTVGAALVCGACVTGVAHVLWAAGMRVWAASLSGLLLVLAPTEQSEVLDVMANTQWVLIPLMVLILLWRPRSRGEAVVAAALLVVGATDSILAFTLAPFVLLRVVVLPLRSKDQLVTAGLLGGLLLQASVVFGGSAGSRPPIAPLPGEGAVAKTIVARSVLAPLGFTAGGGAFETSGWVVPLTMVLLIGSLALTGGWPVRLVLLFAVALEAVVTIYAWFPLWLPDDHDLSLGFGGRYLVPTGVLLAMASFLGPLRARDPGPPLVLGAALLLLSLVGTATDLRDDGTRTQTPPWSQVVSDARQKCVSGAVTDATLEAAPDIASSLPCSMLT